VARKKLTLRTDEELSPNDPSWVKRSLRDERMKNGLMAAAGLAYTAFKIWGKYHDLKQFKAARAIYEPGAKNPSK